MFGWGLLRDLHMLGRGLHVSIAHWEHLILSALYFCCCCVFKSYLLIIPPAAAAFAAVVLYLQVHCSDVHHSAEGSPRHYNSHR